ncbi:protein B4 isoform X2 [Manacus candei]|uniref:protein B4 isoform X2 n=1 Tax=Manacus candei TaxID=415023 RepID=UPI002227284C|nr:protein B4 isoform X2 [Manacus candei]
MEPQMARLPGPLVLGGVARCPSTLQMVKEVLQAQGEKKGASVFTIKRFILAKYPMEDPIRLKYLLKQALSKGLSCVELVRPHNSSAVGATGTFLLAPKEPQHKQHLGQANPDRGQAPKPGQEGITKDPCVPVAGAQQRGTTKQQLAAMKQKPKAKPMDAQPRAAVKPGSDGAKPPRAANHPQAPGTGCSRPPRAADHPQVLGKGCSRPCGTEAVGRSKSDSPVGAGTKGPQKVPGGKSKGKVLKGAQQGPPKAQRGQGQVRKPRVTPGARQGEARLQKAASPGEDRTALSGDPDSLT